VPYASDVLSPRSICYPVIFSIATADLGSYQKIGSGLIAVGVSGGAAYPSMQGALSDAKGTHISYLIPLVSRHSHLHPPHRNATFSFPFLGLSEEQSSQARLTR
jgi:hypothetical protein